MTEASEVKYTLYSEEKSEKLINLLDVYKKDPFAARVIYFNNGNPHDYISTRVVRFDRSDGSFELIVFQKKFGVSITNRIYSRETKLSSVIYVKNRFYYKQGKIFGLLTYNSLYSFLCVNCSTDVREEILSFLINKFSWIRFIGESDVLHRLSFNTVVINKLYSLNKALKYYFKLPISVIRVYIEYLNKSKNDNHQLSGGSVSFNIKYFKSILKDLKNIENLRLEYFTNPYFLDTCRMAKILGRKINCSWSDKRLKLMHNKWASEITYITLSHSKLEDLKIGEVYREFADYSGFRLLTTNLEVLKEGMSQGHCVGTYLPSINNASCAIFHIDGYTLEVRYGVDYSALGSRTTCLYINQFKGPFNTAVPSNLVSMVNDKVLGFNKMIDSAGKVFAKPEEEEVLF